MLPPNFEKYRTNAVVFFPISLVLLVFTFIIVLSFRKETHVPSYISKEAGHFDHGESKCKVFVVEEEKYGAILGKYVICNPPVNGMLQSAPSGNKYDSN